MSEVPVAAAAASTQSRKRKLPRLPDAEARRQWALQNLAGLPETLQLAPRYKRALANSLDPTAAGHGQCLRIYAPNPAVMRFPADVTARQRNQLLQTAMEGITEDAAKFANGGGENGTAPDMHAALCWQLAILGQVGLAENGEWVTGMSIASTEPDLLDPKTFVRIPDHLVHHFVPPEHRKQATQRALVQNPATDLGTFSPLIGAVQFRFRPTPAVRAKRKADGSLVPAGQGSSSEEVISFAWCTDVFYLINRWLLWAYKETHPREAEEDGATAALGGGSTGPVVEEVAEEEVAPAAADQTVVAAGEEKEEKKKKKKKKKKEKRAAQDAAAAAAEKDDQAAKRIAAETAAARIPDVPMDAEPATAPTTTGKAHKKTKAKNKPPAAATATGSSEPAEPKRESIPTFMLQFIQRRAQNVEFLREDLAQGYVQRAPLDSLLPTPEERLGFCFFDRRTDLERDKLAAFIQAVAAGGTARTNQPEVRLDSLNLLYMLCYAGYLAEAFLHEVLHWSRQHAFTFSAVNAPSIAEMLRTNRHSFQVQGILEPLARILTSIHAVEDLPVVALKQMRVLVHFLRAVDCIYNTSQFPTTPSPPVRCALTGRLIPAGLDGGYYTITAPDPDDPTQALRLCMRRYVVPSVFFPPVAKQPPPAIAAAAAAGALPQEPPAKKQKIKSKDKGKGKEKEKVKGKESTAAAAAAVEPTWPNPQPLHKSEVRPFVGELPPFLSGKGETVLLGNALFLQLMTAAMQESPTALDDSMRLLLSQVPAELKAFVKRVRDHQAMLEPGWINAFLSLMKQFLVRRSAPEAQGASEEALLAAAKPLDSVPAPNMPVIIPLVVRADLGRKMEEYYRSYNMLLAWAAKSEDKSVNLQDPINPSQRAAARVLFGPLVHL